MTSRQARLQENTYYRVMRVLQDNPDMIQRELVEQLGISTSCPNHWLKALIDKDWVKVQNCNQSKNKFGYTYVLTLHGMAGQAQLTGRYLKRTMWEYEAPKLKIEVLKSDASQHALDAKALQT